MEGPDRPDATVVLSRAVEGDPQAAAELVPLVYDELRKLAGGYFRRERPGHTLQPTALVHEAYLRLVDRTKIDWRGKTHFLAVAASEMRRVLVHHARRRKAKKWGGGWVRVALDPAILPTGGRELDLRDLTEALAEYAELYPRQARVVDLRFLGGLSIQETAQALELSPKTVEKYWRMARAWLHRRLRGSSDGEGEDR